MNTILDDSYVVMVREPETTNKAPALVERELVTCATYEEAQWIRREYSSPRRKCIIRFIGQSGGGD